MGRTSNGLIEPLRAISDIPRWCVWQKTQEGKKTPINPRTGGGAMANEPSTWTDFDTAYESKVARDGFGFFMGGGYAGIDLDACIDSNGELSDMAGKIVQRMDTYTEKSPSGRGLHILCRVSDGLTLEGQHGRRKDTSGGKIEIYCGAHYLTITGNVYGAEKPIEFRENELLEVYREYFSNTRENDVKKQRVDWPQGQNVSGTTGNESDAELLQYMLDSPNNGAKIRKLFSGDISGYTRTDKDGNMHDDYSAADLALCNYLAYYTRHDAGQMDRLFRQSGLMRPKWDERHGAQTYGEMTIAKAISQTPTAPKKSDNSTIKPSTSIKDYGVYNPADYHSEYDDSGHDDESAQGIDPITPSENGVQNESPSQSESDNNGRDDGASTHSETGNDSGHDSGKNEAHTVLDYLRNSFLSDIDRVKSFSNRKTGYSNIDRYNSLFPGLYVIGSVTGNGKTTFCGQMADYLAQAGEYVLYFSLEQTELELVSKGLARLTAQAWINKKGTDALTKYQHGIDAVSAINIRKGYMPDSVKQAIETYKTFAERLRIIECRFAITADKIIHEVCDFMNGHNGVRPVVFVDYLQIVKPSNSKLPKREAIDDTVERFKKFSAEADIPIFIISSLNRQNYLSVVDFESFKESGGIEYCADVVYGLQLLAMNAQIFNTDSNLQSKRKFVNEQMKATPRKMEIVGLKNRYGVSKSRYFFDYYPAYDLFVPYERSDEDKRTDDEFANELDEKMTAEYQAFEESQVGESGGKSKGKPKRSK